MFAVWSEIKMRTGPLIRVYLLKEAMAFLSSLSVGVQKKVAYNIQRVRNGELDKKIFKKLDGSDIWEFRTLYNKTAYRLFAFWDKEEAALIIATHGMVKKAQRTPAKEIKKAEKIMSDYLKRKNR